MSAAQFFARWRVPVGYPLAILVLFFARPTPRSILYGAVLGVLGLLVRATAAGHLHKQEILTTTGPYAYTRNPLYLGSAILTLGAAVAAHSWLSGILVCGYFAFFYSIAMRLEQQQLRLRHEAALDEYVKAVPLFLPRLTPAKLAASVSAKSFSFAQYKKNREYRAALGFLFLLLIFFLLWSFHQQLFTLL